MPHLVLDHAADFQRLRECADRDSLCIAVAESGLSGVPDNWPRERVLAPDDLFPRDLRGQLVDARREMLAGMIALLPSRARADAELLLSRVIERAILIDAAAAIHGDKVYVAVSDLAVSLQASGEARVAAFLMDGLAGFMPGTRASPDTKAGEITLAPRLTERRHPEISVIRTVLRHFGVSAVEPVTCSAGFDGVSPFPAGRLWFGSWPKVERLSAWPKNAAWDCPPTLGVVMPAHDAAHVIEGTTGAVLAGLGPDDRLVAIENGSRDATWEILAALASRDSRVVLDRLTFPDAATARSRGVALCRTDYIAFCDADDLWSAYKPTVIRDVLRRTGADVLLHPTLTIVDGEPMIDGAHFLAKSLPRADTLLGDLLHAGNFFSTSAVVVRRDLFPDSAFASGLRHTQDYEAWCQLALRHPALRFAWLDEALTYYRHWGGLSNEKRARIVNVSGVIRRYSRHLPPGMRAKVLFRNAARTLWHGLRMRRPVRVAVSALLRSPDPAIRRSATP